MANGYFERGEIYWVRMDTGFGFEQGVGRPGVILSCNSQNNASTTVTIAFCSKQQQQSWGVEIEATGCTSYVKVSQINTVDKTRLGKCIGVLNSVEMKELEDVLEDFFDLGYVDETALKAKDAAIADRDMMIRELQDVTDGYKNDLLGKDNEIASLKMELEMWQKCYGRCMDMLVDMKVNGDVTRRTTVVAPVVTAASMIPEPPKEEPVEEDRLDINSCTATALKKVGFSLAVARKIVESRPFTSVEDLKRVNGVKASLHRILEPKLCCNAMKKPVVNGGVPDPGYEEDGIVPEAPVKPEVQKVNVNLVKTASELTKLTGLCMRSAQGIINYRKEHGNFTCLEDLLKTPAFGNIAMKRYGHLLEV